MPHELTVAEVAVRHGISRKTVQRRIADGSLTPSRKLPGKTGAYLFGVDDADRVFGSPKDLSGGATQTPSQCGAPAQDASTPTEADR